MGIDTESDRAQLVFSILYGLLGSGMLVYSSLKFRSNLRNKAREYILRYHKYINAMALHGWGALVLSLGLVVLLIDQGQFLRFSDGVVSHVAQWVAFAVYTTFTLIVLAEYNRLTILGVEVPKFIGIGSGASFVLLSLSGTIGGWILWSIVGVVLLTAGHVFVWLHTQRSYLYTTFTGVKKGIFDAPDGHNSILDTFLIFHSWLCLTLVWVTYWLSREVEDFIHPHWISEAIYAGLLVLHWGGVALMVNFEFMDVEHRRMGTQHRPLPVPRRRIIHV